MIDVAQSGVVQSFQNKLTCSIFFSKCEIVSLEKAVLWKFLKVCWNKVEGVKLILSYIDAVLFSLIDID